MGFNRVTAGSAALTLTNNNFFANTQDAAYVLFSSGGLMPTLSGNSASGNGVNGVGLGGYVSGNTTLPGAPGIPYVVDDLSPGATTLIVASSGTLTVQAGAVVKFRQPSTGLYVDGSFVASGAAGSRVTFTSFK